MKKVFLDTNIIMEYLAHRKEFDDVQLILSAAYQGGIQAVMSSGCVYTVIYLLGAEFKRQGIHEPEKREKIKESLSVLLEYIDVVDFSTVYVKKAITATDFKDLEDSCQYQCAVENSCDILLTINMKHFKDLESPLCQVASPHEFVEKFISADE